jgi:DnaA family protein
MSPLTPQLGLDLHQSISPTLDNFYVQDNAQILAYCHQVVLGQGDLFAYLSGPTGSGKSHLLQAVYEALIKTDQSQPESKLSSEAVVFIDRYVSNLDITDLDWSAPDLSSTLTSNFNPIVLIDNIELWLGQLASETALFGLFNWVKDHKGSLLVAGQKALGDIDFVLPDLKSRFYSGLFLSLDVLPEDALSQILIDQAKQNGLELSDQLLQFLLSRVSRDMSVLSSILRILDEASMIEQRKLTIPFVKQVLGL